MDKAHYLKRVPLFGGLAAADLRKLQGIARIKQIAAGKPIFGEDTTGDSLYIVLHGRVKIFTSSGTRKKTLAYLEQGEFFGEISLLDRRPRSASCLATEDCSLMIIKKNDFRALLLSYPRMCLQVLETLSRRLRQADCEIESLSFEDVLGRVAGVLLKFAKQDMRTGLSCVIMSQREIAEIVGTGREVVSRIIGRFKRLQCIRIEDKAIVVMDSEKLRRFAR